MGDKPNQPNRPNQPSHSNQGEDAAFLRALLESLNAEDPTVFNELMMSNPTLADEFHRSSPEIARLHEALSQVAGVHDDDPAFAKIVAQIKDRLENARRSPLVVKANGSDSDALAGILTDVTRQLSVEQAKQLFEKLSPMLVYTALKHLDRNCSLDEVERIAHHLCDEPIQARLRAAEHVRDALVDELSLALELEGLSDLLDRAQMTRVLEESGAMVDLVAMANCITLAKTQAG